MLVNAENLDFKELNQVVREIPGDVVLTGVLGQRFIGAGLENKMITIDGVPGNALGAYLNGATIITGGNAQDAVGDTMNDGEIVVHGNIGDAAGYAMRGGKILVKGNAGYRLGIHMKAYKSKSPVIVIGGRAGSFLGEYQAGGLIIVLGLHDDGKEIVGEFPCTGMHGGRIVIRSDCSNISFPKGVSIHTATKEELDDIKSYIEYYCETFECDVDTIMASTFTIVTPDSKNPYKQLYVGN
ncbi:MAG: glutamate synthase [Clostridia bacterium]|nr:glutamate synthase [Clostridia bacterium]